MNLQKTKFFLSLAFCLIFHNGLAQAITLRVSNAIARPGQVVQIYIDSDNAVEIAGMVFTISYDTTSLDLQEITNGGFFHILTVGEEVAGKGRNINGARTETGAWPGHLLTLSFRIKKDDELQDGEITGDYEITIVQSNIFDPEAGYDPPETLPMAWGLDPSQDPLLHPELAFPTLQVSVVPGTISIDRDGDELTDVREQELGTDKDNPDTDGDGMPDGWEVNANLDPLDNQDAFTDKDGDGYSNLREYISGTEPDSDQSKPSGLIADLDEDKDVDGVDLYLLSRGLEEGQCPETPCTGDLDGNGMVDSTDIRLFLEEFGKQ